MEQVCFLYMTRFILVFIRIALLIEQLNNPSQQIPFSYRKAINRLSLDNSTQPGWDQTTMYRHKGHAGLSPVITFFTPSRSGCSKSLQKSRRINHGKSRPGLRGDLWATLVPGPARRYSILIGDDKSRGLGRSQDHGCKDSLGWNGPSCLERSHFWIWILFITKYWGFDHFSSFLEKKVILLLISKYHVYVILKICFFILSDFFNSIY